MKNSQTLFMFGAAVLFFWLIDGFSWHLSWESRLVKLGLVSLVIGVAYWLKNSKSTRLKKGALVITLLLATGVVYAEPYISHALSGHHHHYHYNHCYK